MPPLLEFIVQGTPVSGPKGGANLKKWRRRVEEQARLNWKKAPLTQKLSSILIHFHKGDIAPLDNDNMSKPVHDALTKVVYDDDRQVIHTRSIQTSVDSPIAIEGATQVLLDSIALGDGFLYIRIDEIPVRILLAG
jgi:Endodeoxyribonuclease RusA